MEKRDGSEAVDPRAETLDAGLQAAFGDGSLDFGPSAVVTGSVMEFIQESIGPCSPVLLREEDREPSPIVKPLSREVSTQLASSRYQIVGEIARGGVGVVMKSRDVDLGRDVAMKILRADQFDKSDMVRRFVEEAQITGQLQHPGILPVYELGMQGERTPYFTMKLVRGKTLANLLQDRASADDDRVRFLKMFESICHTLAYAHAKGVLHRDLKPANILVGRFGEVQVVDWGLAKVLGQGGLADERAPDESVDESIVVETVRSSSAEGASQVGSVMGTPAYMAPEQARGETARIDERADVFSLGAILCEILTGDPPFTGDRYDALDRARAGDVSRATAAIDAVDIDDELRGIALSCLAPARADRPRHAGVLAERVSGYLSSLEERARSAEVSAVQAQAQAQHEHRARRLTLALAVVVVIFISVIAVGGVWLQARAADDERKRDGLLNGSVVTAAERFAAAKAAPVGEEEPWLAARLAMEQVRNLIGTVPDVAESRARAQSLIARFDGADRDRKVIVNLESVVIRGATHLDPTSWKRMEEDLRKAFLEYGIDVVEDSNDVIVTKIVESELAPQIVDAFELWMGTCGHLLSMGVQLYPVQELMGRLEVLYEADPEPFATRVRKILYSQQPVQDDLDSLLADADFAGTRPRTLAWLASVCHRTGNVEALHSVFRRALALHPDDFMLNFDYAYNLVLLREWQMAVRYQMRCLVIRPKSAGVWRCLGNALRETGELDESERSLRQSIELDDHPPTYVDLGTTLERLERADDARRAYQEALSRDPDLEAAKSALEKLE